MPPLPHTTMHAFDGILRNAWRVLLGSRQSRVPQTPFLDTGGPVVVVSGGANPLEIKNNDDQSWLDLIFNEEQTDLVYELHENTLQVFNSTTNQPIATYKKTKNLGSNGDVYEFTDRTNAKRKIAIKIDYEEFKGDEEDEEDEGYTEYDVILTMKDRMERDHEKGCDVIRLRRILTHTVPEKKGKRPNVYVMELMDSDLHTWIEKTSADELINEANRILTAVEDQMLCLMNIDPDFVYTDLKPANIGILLRGSRIRKIHLIDLGSVLQDKNGDYTFTYPCMPLNAKGNLEFKDETSKKTCITTQLFFLMIRILKPYIQYKKNTQLYENLNELLELVYSVNRGDLKELHASLADVTNALNTVVPQRAAELKAFLLNVSTENKDIDLNKCIEVCNQLTRDDVVPDKE